MTSRYRCKTMVLFLITASGFLLGDWFSDDVPVIKQEREKVLDELENWLLERHLERVIKSQGRSEDYEFIDELYFINNIDEQFRAKIKELRSEGK